MRTILIVLIISCLHLSFQIPEIFRKDFEGALLQLKAQEALIGKIADDFTASPEKVISIVAPELIRYSLFKDFFETKALECLYVNYGPEAADFSIGSFQMKPSFIERMEQEIRCTPALSVDLQRFLLCDELDEKSKRKERLRRLKSFEWQVVYAFCYYEMMKIRFEDYPFLNEQEKFQFFASAYNYGFDRPVEEIRDWMKAQAFPFGRKYQTEQLAYHEFSVTFYEHLTKKSHSSP